MVRHLADAYHFLASLPADGFWLSNRGGLFGDVSAAAVILSFFLLSRHRIFNWEIPLLGLLAFSGTYFLVDSWLRPGAGGNFLFFLVVPEFWLVLLILGTEVTTTPFLRGSRLAGGVLLGGAAALLLIWLPPEREPLLLAVVILNLFTPLLNLLFYRRRARAR